MSITTTSFPTKAKPITPQRQAQAPAGPNQNPDLSSSLGSARSSRSSKLGQTPPYWNRHQRSVSNVSYVSINAPTRRTPIQLEDHTEEPDEISDGLWAKDVTIDGHHVVTGRAIGAGAYVVWHCSVQTLEVG